MLSFNIRKCIHAYYIVLTEFKFRHRLFFQIEQAQQREFVIVIQLGIKGRSYVPEERRTKLVVARIWQPGWGED